MVCLGCGCPRRTAVVLAGVAAARPFRDRPRYLLDHISVTVPNGRAAARRFGDRARFSFQNANACRNMFGVTKSSHSRMRTRASCTRAPCTHAFAAHDGGAHRVATALPAHRHARARFPAPCARAHASTAHSARAQHACARLAGDAHALTRQHTLARQKLDVMLEALAIC